MERWEGAHSARPPPRPQASPRLQGGVRVTEDGKEETKQEALPQQPAGSMLPQRWTETPLPDP